MVTLSDTGDERGERMRVKRRGWGKARWPHPAAVTSPSGKCSERKTETSYWEARGVCVSSHLEATLRQKQKYVRLDVSIWLASTSAITSHLEAQPFRPRKELGYLSGSAFPFYRWEKTRKLRSREAHLPNVAGRKKAGKKNPDLILRAQYSFYYTKNINFYNPDFTCWTSKTLSLRISS